MPKSTNPQSQDQGTSRASLTPLQRQTRMQAVHALLPQTQCQRCGFADCQAYAFAIVDGKTQINRCQPGGVEGIQRLANVTGHKTTPLANEVGEESGRTLAVIDENWCIGCTKCILVCPVDAIMGTHKHMHTVLEEYCTGCELCVPVCPVDCIELLPSSNQNPSPTAWAAWSQEQAKQALQRYTQHIARQNNTKSAKNALTQQNVLDVKTAPIAQSQTFKRDFMADIIQKAREQKK